MDPEETNEAKEPVTDIVPEQLGSGEEEPAPTPTVEDAKKEEVTEAGGLEQVDEDLEELKMEEKDPATDVTTTEPSQTVETGGEHTPQVTEETPETAEEKEEKEEEVNEPVAESSEHAAAAPEPRKQERVENPKYTLEITGTKYNPNNFWSVLCSPTKTVWGMQLTYRTGRWRTRWIVDQAAGEVSGSINVDVHYYEQGNVGPHSGPDSRGYLITNGLGAISSRAHCLVPLPHGS